MADVIDKYRRFSQQSLETGRQQEVIGIAARLNSLSDVGELMAFMRF